MNDKLIKDIPKLSDIHTIAFDFDGVFTDNKVYINQNGDETVCCSRSDGLAFDFLRAYEKYHNLDLDYFILSKETNPVVSKRAEKLKLKCLSGVSNKLNFMDDYLDNKNSKNTDKYKGFVYLGNDLNDLLLMAKSGFSVAPIDAHPEVIRIADLVLDKKGGDGFVRLFIEKLLGLDRLNKEDLYEFISNC